MKALQFYGYKHRLRFSPLAVMAMMMRHGISELAAQMMIARDNLIEMDKLYNQLELELKVRQSHYVLDRLIAIQRGAYSD